ncbi:hypothetical protein CCACVL1_00292 [Corchorus capsularis]|uniref:Uncharacterized protein n=1 Tax=Corchorus capsularis TaxID=210143 RepID=A0A1R3KXJ8_COCAP|nr:hypothetical protein CCACVL1_00292 [Corchorus capsularis]
METKDKDSTTQDGTVDLRGRPVLASKTGKWKACAFLVGRLFFGFIGPNCSKWDIISWYFVLHKAYL